MLGHGADLAESIVDAFAQAEKKKRPPWRKMLEKVRASVQFPPLRSFSRADLI